MRLLPHWKKILTRAWSSRLMVIAGILSGLEAALPVIVGFIDIPTGVFAVASGLVTMLALIARLIAQKNLKETSE